MPYNTNISLSIIRKALKAFKEGKSIDDYDIPNNIKESIKRRKYSREELSRYWRKDGT